MATKRRRPGPRTKASTSSAPAAAKATALGANGGATGDRYAVAVRYKLGKSIDGFKFQTSDEEFYPAAEEWTYVVANRRRITRASRDALAAQLFTHFEGLAGVASAGGFRRQVADMARADYVEVELPHGQDGVGWVARAFPWESAISLLTRPERGDHVLTVVRHLHRGSAGAASHPGPSTLLVVRSGPGKLGEMFDLNAECRLVVDALELTPAGRPDAFVTEPDYEDLCAAIRVGEPSVVHLAGVDPWSLEWYKLAELRPEDRQGFVLRGPGGPYEPVDPIRLARALTCGRRPPYLVAVSTCFSAAVVAPAIVAHGARHAIGFQDVITDADAMLFFGAFYRVWNRKSDELLAAFRHAQRQCLREFGRQVTNPVLWSDRSLLQGAAGATRHAPAARDAKPADLRVHAEPVKSLNYSLLHNNRDVFSKLFIDKPGVGALPPLQVEVALETGSAVCRCRFAETLPVEATTVQLVEKVRLPLVADLLRRCTESLRTNLHLRVECDGALVCEETHRVTILPADEWRDDGRDHCWLPSFVLPRDPGVLRVVTAAQRYLRTLLDDCGAGFDGYQQVSDDQANAADVVDPQVQAIWAALQYELPLAYINPPPAYTSLSQRLRGPTQILDGRAATCIDLALLFASCLEFVGIYPTIFLVTGHAFPGYWRSAKAWGELREFGTPGTAPKVSAGTPDGRLPVTRGQGEGWMLTVANLREVLEFVQAGLLVPFESTHVTHHRGFFEALELGPSLLHPESFDAMIDVQLAREAEVTPLPLVNGVA